LAIGAVALVVLAGVIGGLVIRRRRNLPD